MKPVDVKSSTYIGSIKEFDDQDPKFEIGDILRISKLKTFLQKIMFQVGLKKFSLLKTLKTLCCGHMLLMILKTKKLLERFKNCKKQIKKSLELKK